MFIMLVESDMGNRRLVRRIMEPMGHKVIECRDLVELIQYLEQIDVWPNLILLDIKNLNNSTRASLYGFNHSPRWCYLPFLLTKNITKQEKDETAILLGALGIVPKAFDIDTFQRYINFTLLASS